MGASTTPGRRLATRRLTNSATAFRSCLRSWNWWGGRSWTADRCEKGVKSATAHMIRKPTHSQIRAIIQTVEQWRKAIVAERLPFPNPNPYEATLFMQTEVGETVDALIRRYSRTAYTRASGNPKRAHLYLSLIHI